MGLRTNDVLLKGGNVTENRYNLLDEAWIPIADMGKAGLLRVFGGRECRALGGTAVQKIAVLKLLIAIAQAAATPQDTQEWAAMGPDGLGERCTLYLEQWRDAFWLYGDKPFLQMPACSKAELKPYGTAMPQVASGNTTLLTHLQLEPIMSDASRALLLVEQMGFGLGGKKTDQRVILSKGYVKKKSAKSGPSISYNGILHSFLLGNSLLETVWLNLLTRDVIVDNWQEGVGTAPWEKMPEGEDCPTARALKASLMGRLVPLSRFCLLREDGLHYVEGIDHPDHLSGVIDPSAAADKAKTEFKMLWVDLEKKPWRQLTALLSFLESEHNSGFECLNLKQGIPRLADSRAGQFGIWSGGLKVSKNSGEYYLKGDDDCIESKVWLDTALVAGNLAGNDDWFLRLKIQMGKLEKMGKVVYGATRGYFSALNAQGDAHAAEASGLFWQLVEPTFQELIQACYGDGKERLAKLMGTYAVFAGTTFDESCPHGTARQFEAWARHRPGFGVFSQKKQSSS